MYDDCCFGTASLGGYSPTYTPYRQVYIVEHERLGGYEQELRPDITEKSIYNLINDDVFEPIKPLKRRLTVRILLSIINMVKWVCRL